MADTSIRALSLDMGGTHIGCGLVEDERLLSSTTVPSAGSCALRPLLESIAQTLHSLLDQAGLRPADCAGLAIGFPGIVNARAGRVLTTFKKYEDTIDLDLPQWSLNTFGIPLRLENDARMAMLGEHHAGSAKGVSDAVMMTLGTGIGSAALIRGRLLCAESIFRLAAWEATCPSTFTADCVPAEILDARKRKRVGGRCRS